MESDIKTFYGKEKIYTDNTKKLLIIGMMFLWLFYFATSRYLFFFSSLIFSLYTPYFFLKTKIHLKNLLTDSKEAEIIKVKEEIIDTKVLSNYNHKKYIINTVNDTFLTENIIYKILKPGMIVEISYYKNSKFIKTISIL